MKRDLISIDDVNRTFLNEYLDRADRIAKLPEREAVDLLRGRVLSVMFFEPSTRTRLSFEAAMLKLGGSVIGFSESGNTSAAKGESLRDTVRTVEQYADALVIRHPQEGAARLAAESIRIPVINAGDGANQHPTQTLLDLYTIQRFFGKIDGLKVALVGDLRFSRTIHSLVHALTMYKNVTFRLVSPSFLRLPDHYHHCFHERGHTFHESDDLPTAVRESDLIYVTRVQRERFADPLDYEKVKNALCLDGKIARLAQPHAKILHPLPRVNEISPEVDELPQAGYFEQVRNGLIMRQAILAHLLKGDKRW